jgi:hypothetical protein
MLRSAISAFTRVFDALWCAADPGSTSQDNKWQYRSRLCGAKNAAPRPGHERNLLSALSSDLPVGLFVDRAVESFFRIFRKIFVAT